MRTTTKRIIFVSTLVVLGSSAFVFYRIWRSIHENGYGSCLASIADDIWLQKETRKLAEASSDWKILSDEETDQAMRAVHGHDCAAASDLSLDLEKNRIHIAVRKPDKGRWPPIIVWSNGSDGLSGTSDDIVMPYGQTVPK